MVKLGEGRNEGISHFSLWIGVQEGKEQRWKVGKESGNQVSKATTARASNAAQRSAQCASGAAKDKKGSGLVCWIITQPPHQVQSSNFTLALSRRARVR